MNNFEKMYYEIGNNIITNGNTKNTRNGKTKSLFGVRLEIAPDENEFPLLVSRRIFYKGVLGELAAFYRQPKTLKDFEDQGCNYWKLWANDDGSINVNYGNSWINFSNKGINQLEECINLIKNNPDDRRILIVGYDPTTIKDLSLPSCHILYQFYVNNDNTLDMMWYQRSADWAIGVPSDIILGYTMIINIASATGRKPGKLIMNFGDAHLYEEHIDQFSKVDYDLDINYPKYKYTPPTSIYEFTNKDIEIFDYKYNTDIKYILKA